MDMITLAAAKSYTKKTLDGMGSLQGKDGKSAYQIWLDNGNKGTEQDFLNSLKGTKGDKGDKGATGPKGDTGATGAQGEKGEQGIQGIQGIQGEKGADGAKGQDGADGISATHSWNGTTLTITSASGTSSADLKGEKGEQGIQGENGSDGADGVGIKSVVQTTTSSADGGSNIITVTKTDNTTSTFTVKNGSKGSKGDKGDTGSKGADGYTPVKGTDYFTEADKTEMVEKVAALLEGIPDYWQIALDEGVEAINTAMTTAGYNKSAFLFYSDVHWNYGSKMSPRLLKYLYQHTAMTKTFFGGDIVNDEAADYDTMNYLWDWRNQLKDLPNHHSVVGNHDDGNSTNNLFSEQYVYGYLLAAEETPEVMRGAEGMYYYIDHSPEKTRYLYLDTAYKGATDKQQAFVREALLSTPEGWHIVAVSHIWHDTIYSGANREVGDLNTNASVFLAMFDNYNSRVGDYADCGGWVEFCIGGHTHLDHDSTSSTGIPIILVATDSQHTGGGASFTYGTDTEASVNGIVADYDNHKIYIVRIGRGESRTVNVTNYVVTYTNMLPISTDADGSVYNGVGYKSDVQWSASSNAETAADGIVLSGYIPVSNGDIIRLKNIRMSKDATENAQCMVFFFSDLGVVSGNHNANNLTAYNSAVWDEDNMLAQFTLVGEEIKYIRLQGTYMGADSIVTINEPIE